MAAKTVKQADVCGGECRCAGAQLKVDAEVERLRAQLRSMTERLEAERAHRRVLQRAVGYATARARSLERPGDGEQVLTLDRAIDDALVDGLDENIYVFDDEDESGAAFDRFFAQPDPHLDKVRGFLLD